jgi:hypothetical protein
MAIVDAWLRDGQNTVDYADNLGLDVCTFLDWVMEYGRLSDPSILIPVRILDGHPDRQRFTEDDSGAYLKSDAHLARAPGTGWIPVVIQGGRP